MATVGADFGLADPDEAWRALQCDPKALLVDVRSKAEWTFVGVPDLSAAAADALFVEWSSFPAMAANPAFVQTVAQAVQAADANAVYFICRSGARSAAAAGALAPVLAEANRATRLFNVVEGFEGDLDGEGHRGRANGWKARGLPWRQS